MADRGGDGVTGDQEREVLDQIRRAKAHGLTDDELETLAGLPHQSASARRRGLVLKGFVKSSGKRRMTSNGKLAMAWVAGKEEARKGSQCTCREYFAKATEFAARSVGLGSPGVSAMAALMKLAEDIRSGREL